VVKARGVVRAGGVANLPQVDLLPPQYHYGQRWGLDKGAWPFKVGVARPWGRGREKGAWPTHPKPPP